METQPKNSSLNVNDEQDQIDDTVTDAFTNEAIEDDGTPVLDEKDLEENNLSVEEAEDIEWEEPQQS